MTLLSSTNPSDNYSVIDSIEVTPPEALPQIIDIARVALDSWRYTALSERIVLLQEVYDIFDIAREDIASILSREIGMPIRQAREEVENGMLYFR